MIALLAFLAPTTWAFSQTYGVRGYSRGGTQPSDDPPFIEYDPWIENTPFVDPGYFDHDLQFFAPAEVEEFGSLPKAHVGWYFDYARMNVRITTPELGVDSNGMSDTWGNRIQVGYFTENQSGWMFEYVHIDGPSGSDINQIEDRVNPNQIRIQEIASLDSFENFGDYQHVELLKAYRLDQFDNGGTMEVFYGLGYAGFTDRSGITGDFGLIDITGNVNPFIPDEPKTTPETHNQIWQLVLGSRYRKQTGRWVLSTEARMKAGINFQRYAPFERLDADPTFTFPVTTEIPGQTRDEFVASGDFRLQAEFKFTRDISLTAGFELIHYGMGIARYGNPEFNNEDLTIAGATFGAMVNR